jgi:hypothetical protein
VAKCDVTTEVNAESEMGAAVDTVAEDDFSETAERPGDLASSRYADALAS